MNNFNLHVDLSTVNVKNCIQMDVQHCLIATMLNQQTESICQQIDLNKSSIDIICVFINDSPDTIKSGSVTIYQKDKIYYRFNLPEELVQIAIQFDKDRTVLQSEPKTYEFAFLQMLTR